MDEIRALIERVSIIRDTIREICDVQNDFTREADNLYRILRRLQQEIARDNSPLNRNDDTRRDNLKRFSDDCLQKLDESDQFLGRCRGYHDLKAEILQAEGKIPLSDTDREVLRKFQADFIYYAFHISHLTVKASMDCLEEAKDLIDNGSSTLRYTVNVITARLLAGNELSISTLAADPRGDYTLWEEVSYTLRQEGFADSFTKKHRRSILAYIKALERRTAFEHIGEPPVGFGGWGTARWEAAQDGPYGKSDYDSQSSRYYDESEDHPGKPLSRKRTRSNEDTSRQTRRDGRVFDFQSQSSAEQDHKPGFRASDPMKVFQDFKEKEGPNFLDEEILIDFLNEEPAQPPNVRDKVRDIYRAYDAKYDQDCESLLSPRSSRDQKKDVKAYAGLIHEVEKQVLAELDKLHLGADIPLHGIKKKIINKVVKALEDLEEAKKRFEGS